MKAKWFITFIVLASMLGWVSVTVSAASGAGDGKSRGSGGVPLQIPTGMSIHHARLGDPANSAIQRVVDLRPLKGIIYKPVPNDYDGTGNGIYSDSDFTNDDFQQLWGPDNHGRDDIGNLASAGVNFLHFYDWNQPGAPMNRNHANFLNYCQSKSISVAVPISNWYVQQVQNTSPDYQQYGTAWFDNFVREVYPNGKRHPAVVMWSLGNEFDEPGNQLSPQGIVMTAQAIIAAEDKANIPLTERIAFTAPVSFGLRNSNNVPAAGAVLLLKDAFNIAGLSTVFTNRFIASVNTFNPGSDLGPWAETNFPAAVPDVKFCLFEMGRAIDPVPPSLVRDETQQGDFYKDQLAATLKIANEGGPFLGGAVFSTVNELYKITPAGAQEATYGVWKINVNGGLGTGTTTSGNGSQSYPIDSWTAKPSFTSMQQAYTVSATANPNTVVQVRNSASTAVEVWIKVQLPPAVNIWPRDICVYDVLELTVTGTAGNIPITAPFSPDHEAGFFNLPIGETVTIASTKLGGLLNGILISFVRESQCPCGVHMTQGCSSDKPGLPGHDIPNGVNAAELTLNIPISTPHMPEGADITCVNGANAKIQMNYDPGSGKNWYNGDLPSSDRNVTQIHNSWVDIAKQQDNNSTLSGVFPYNCDDCIQIINAPCGNRHNFAPFPTERHCQVGRDRDPTNGFGGTVTITYLGTLAPPTPFTIDSDLGNDIDTDSTDLSQMLLAFGVYPPASEPGPEDLNKDGVLDNTDLGLVLLHFGY